MTEIEFDATQTAETDKAIRCRLADGREVWVPKSVGRMAQRPTQMRYGFQAFDAGSEFGGARHKSVLLVPQWFARKLAAA